MVKAEMQQQKLNLVFNTLIVILKLFKAIVIILTQKKVANTLKVLKIAWVDRLAGAAFGGVKMLLIAGVLLNVYEGIYKSIFGTAPTPIESYSYEPLLKSVSVVMDFIGNYGITFGS